MKVNYITLLVLLGTVGINVMAEAEGVTGNQAKIVTSTNDYENGVSSFLSKDAVIALKKYKSAASKNDAFAQLQLGNIYNQGLGVKQDYSEAVSWYKLAAANGLAGAQYNLASKYELGQGVLQDHVEAVHWYKLAAAQGLVNAQHHLGYMYAMGLGSVQDYRLAHMWFSLGSVKGDIASTSLRDTIATKMTAQQIAEAQKLAKECQARNFKSCD